MPDDPREVLTPAGLDAVVAGLQLVAVDTPPADRVALLAALERLRHAAAEHVRAMATATACLRLDDRLSVDDDVAPHAAALTPRGLEGRARCAAYELDPVAATRQHDTPCASGTSRAGRWRAG